MEPGLGSAGRAEGRAAWSRREFLGVAAAVGLLGPTSLAWAGDAPAAKPAGASRKDFRLGPDTLARGLLALSRVHPRGWVPGHAGAAVIAAHYFAEDNALDEATTRALRRQVDAFAQHPEDYPPGAPVDPGSGTADPARIVETLDEKVAELGSGGHDKIYASLALRALRDLPDFATPAVVDGICRVIEVFQATSSKTRPSRWTEEHPMAPYRAPADLAQATLRAIQRPWSHLREVGTSGVLHWVTHAEALLTLEDLGYRDVARRGWAAQQLHVNRPVEDGGDRPPDRPAIEWLRPPYWESDAPRCLFQNSWLAGHSFKLPYSLFRLLRRVDDPAIRSAALHRASLLYVPFQSC
jgi:hypothetical protein